MDYWRNTPLHMVSHGAADLVLPFPFFSAHLINNMTSWATGALGDRRRPRHTNPAPPQGVLFHLLVTTKERK